MVPGAPGQPPAQRFGPPPGQPPGQPYGRPPAAPAYGGPGGAAPYSSKKRSLLWLWVTLAVAAVLVVAVVGTAIVVRPWEDVEVASADDSSPVEETEETGGDPSSPEDDLDPADDAVTGDLDGDGYGDVVAVLYDQEAGGDPVYLQTTLTSTGTSFEMAEEPLDAYEDRIHSDWDGDGDVEDLTWSLESGDALSLSSEEDGVGGGPFGGFELFEDAPWVSLLGGDVDGDGDQDAVIYGQEDRTSTTLWVALNDGSGSLDEPAVWATLQDADFTSTTLLPGDFDQDGSFDLLARVPSGKLGNDYYDGDYEWVLLGSTGSAFQPGQVSPDDEDYYGSYAAGDFRGDGTTTVAKLTGLTDEVLVELFEYDGGVVRQVPAWDSRMPLGKGYLSNVTVSDVDGNGADDLVYIDKESDKNRFSGYRVATAGATGFTGDVWAQTPTCEYEYCYLYFQHSFG